MGCVVHERLNGALVWRRRHTCSWLLRGSWPSDPRAPWSSILGSQGEIYTAKTENKIYEYSTNASLCMVSLLNLDHILTCLTIQRQDPAYRSLHQMAPPALRTTLRPRSSGRSNTPKKLHRHLSSGKLRHTLIGARDPGFGEPWSPNWQKLRTHLPHRDRLLLQRPTDSRPRWPPL